MKVEWSLIRLNNYWSNNYKIKSCKYRPAICLVMYSRVTGSSTVSLCDWHSILDLSIRIRASAVSPAKAITTWSSSRHILRTVLSSWSLATDFFSTPRTMRSFPLMPTWKMLVIVKRMSRLVYSMHLSVTSNTSWKKLSVMAMFSQNYT